MTKTIIFALFLIALSTQTSMNPREVANKFYSSFKNKDYETMNSLYSESATFYDEMFHLGLTSKQVQAHWNMLIDSQSIFEFEYEVISVQDNVVKTNWTALSTYWSTGRKVRKSVIDYISLNKEGKIYKQVDEYDLCAWAWQAFPFQQAMEVCRDPRPLRRNAADNLRGFILRNPQYK